jgi:predicted nucleic acid-binding protein
MRAGVATNCTSAEVRVFVDTNLWAYRLDQREPDKSQRVGAWLRALAEDHEIVVSTQVLIELRSVLTRKLKPALTQSAPVA